MLEKALEVLPSSPTDCPENHSLLRMAIWLRGLERWYLVLGGVAVCRGFEHQSNLEPFFAEIIVQCIYTCMEDLNF
jgi:hypothetical protein